MDTITPLAPLTDDELRAASDSFDEGGDDFDGMCILSDITNIATRAICRTAGVDFYDAAAIEDDDVEFLREEAAVIIAHLIHAGVLRRDDFVYDDDTHAFAHV